MVNLNDLINEDLSQKIPRDPAKSKEYFERGKQALRAENLEVALMNFEAADRLDPFDVEIQDEVKLTKGRIHYNKGVALHEAGGLVAAVQEYRQANELGVHDFTQFKEWEECTDYKSGSGFWDGISKVARTLEQLIQINNTLWKETPESDQIAERKLKDLEFDSSYIHPFLYEVTHNGGDQRLLGIAVSDMINKVIESGETITLDLSKYTTATKKWEENKWTGDYLGYEHKRGKLVIRGGIIFGGCVSSRTCYRMSGGEVEIYSDFGGRLELGAGMTGGKIKLYGKNIDEDYNDVGEGMSNGEINIVRGGNFDSIGSEMTGGKINIRGHTNLERCMGPEMSGGKITIVGNVKYKNVRNEKPWNSYCGIGTKMNGGRIQIDGYVGVTHLGDRMKNGNVHVKGKVYAKIGEYMSGGQITIENRADSRRPIGEGMSGGLIRIQGSALEVIPPYEGGQIKVNGDEMTIHARKIRDSDNCGEVWFRGRKIFPSIGFRLNYFWEASGSYSSIGNVHDDFRHITYKK